MSDIQIRRRIAAAASDVTRSAGLDAAAIGELVASLGELMTHWTGEAVRVQITADGQPEGLDMVRRPPQPHDVRSALPSGPVVLRLEGSPIEIGGQVWERLCLPAVRQSSRHLQPEHLAHLYGGIVMSCWGAMAADFGEEQARGLADQMVEAFKAISLSAPAGSSLN